MYGIYYDEYMGGKNYITISSVLIIYSRNIIRSTHLGYEREVAFDNIYDTCHIAG